jgi:hypothetical protein
MNIQAQKIELAKMILETDNPALLESIKNIFNKQIRPDFWETLSTDQKKEIEIGILEIEQGEIVSYEDLMKKFRK